MAKFQKKSFLLFLNVPNFGIFWVNLLKGIFEQRLEVMQLMNQLTDLIFCKFHLQQMLQT